MKFMLACLLLVAIQLPVIVSVTPPGTPEYKEPQVAIENDGHVYVSYGMGNAVYVSVSSDMGKTYGNPVKVAESGNLSLGMRRGPRIAANKGLITITAIYGQKGKSADGDILTF